MKIFVQIASYRDPDLNNTIQDIYNKATHPENITIGLCHQYGDDDWDNPELYTNKDNIKVLSFQYNDSKGACWARSITQSLFANEEFTLQIDSHSRFEQGWDVSLLDQYDRINDSKAVISTYPSMFTPGDHYDKWDKRLYSCHVYNMKDGFISARPRYVQDLSYHTKAIAIAAGFIFGPSSIIHDVKYDPEFYFTGEEASLALRLFTNGYNLYHPNIRLIYHYYTRKENKKHWSDHKNHYEYTKKSYDKLHCLLGRNKNYDLKNYGLGDIRTIEEWRQYSGIDYINKMLHIDVIAGNPPPYKDNKESWVTQQQMNAPAKK